MKPDGVFMASFEEALPSMLAAFPSKNYGWNFS
jgi:hypothetical protein